MILLFGGTTEGKQVAAILDSLNQPYYYSTKTEVSFKGHGKAIYGAMTSAAIDRFCATNGITHIINASHPFAEVLHDTISEIKTALPIIRFQRAFPSRTNHSLVTYVSNYTNAIELFITEGYTSLLALSGVQTISKLSDYWEHNKTWFRILDRDSSRAIASQSNFLADNLLYGYPQSKTEEVLLLKVLNPEVIFTKESGTNGKLEQKIAAAIETETPIVILSKPLLSKRYICVENKTELLKALHSV